MALKKIIWANLKSKKGNFISIFVLVFVIALTLSTIISVTIGSKNRVAVACKNSDIGEITTFIQENKLTDEIIQKIQNSDKVDKFVVKNSVVATKFEINGNLLDSFCQVTNYEPEKNSYEMYRTDGISLSDDKETKPQSGEIYLPIALKKMLDCKIGDTVTIDTDNGKIQLTIAKFFEEPFAGSSMISVKIVLISDADFEELHKNQNPDGLHSYTIASLHLKDEYKDQQNQIKKEINADTELMDSGFYTFTRKDANTYMTIFIEILNGMLSAVAILLYIVVLIIIGHSVSTSIDMDYLTFGILKAEGFTSWQIRISIVLEYLLAGAAGALLGILASMAVIKYINAVFIPITGLCTGTSLMLPQILCVIAILLLLIAVYVIAKTKKVISISPMQAIANGSGSVYFSSRANVSVAGNMAFGVNGKLVIKQIAGDWKKYVTTVFVMAILVFFTMSITSMKQISRGDNLYEVFGGNDSDISITYSDKSQTTVDDITKEIEDKAEIAKQFSVTGQYVSIDSEEMMCRILDRPETANAILKGRAPKYDNEIMVTQITSEIIGKRVGDKVNIKHGGVQHEYIIVGIFQDTSEAGKAISMLESGYKHLSPDFKFDIIYYKLADKDQLPQLLNSLKEKYAAYEANGNIKITDEYAKNEESHKTILAAVDSMTAIEYMLAMVFSGIISFMICQKNFNREKNDMGVLKSVGFTSGSLRRMFVIKYSIVVMVGAVIGIVLNIIFNNSVVSLLLRSMGLTKFVTTYTLSLLLVPSLFVLICTAFFAGCVSAKIKKVSPKNLINE